MRLVSTLILTILPCVIFCQTLKGKVYDSKSVVEDIKVWNKTQNRLTITDKNGSFNIEAKLNDTIAFQSMFYYPKVIIVKAFHFEDNNVFEIKKIVNELDEIEIQDSLRSRFDSISFYRSVENEKKVLSEKPLIKSGENLMPTLDLKLLFNKVSKLFAKKHKDTISRLPINYKQLASLFKTSDLFTEEMLVHQLKIPKDKTAMFLVFVSDHYLSSELLQGEKQMHLLDELVAKSELFLILLEQYGEESFSKQ